jgi:hypothetical protein
MTQRLRLSSFVDWTRGRKAFLGSPSALHAGPNSPRADACSFSPIEHNKCFAVECDAFVSSGVTSLFCACGPSHIARLVIAIVVDSVKRVFCRGARSNITKKCLERMNPLGGNRYPTASVPNKGIGVPVGTTGFHVCPNAVFGKAAFPVSNNWAAFVRASTRRHVARTKKCAGDYPRVPAVAEARKGQLASDNRVVPHHYEASESCPGGDRLTFDTRHVLSAPTPTRGSGAVCETAQQYRFGIATRTQALELSEPIGSEREFVYDSPSPITGALWHVEAFRHALLYCGDGKTASVNHLDIRVSPRLCVEYE